MDRSWMGVLWAVMVAAGAVHAQSPQEPLAARMNSAAQQWLGRAESGDLIPAWDVEEPPQGIPPAYATAPAIIKETSPRCRWRYRDSRRDLLSCLEIFGPYVREDTPRAQLILPRIKPPTMPIRRPPVAVVDVR